MNSDAVAISAVVMLGIFLTVIAWQILAIGRTAVARGDRGKDLADEVADLTDRVAQLEEQRPQG